jgi:hypothetical protein
MQIREDLNPDPQQCFNSFNFDIKKTGSHLECLCSALSVNLVYADQPTFGPLEPALYGNSHKETSRMREFLQSGCSMFHVRQSSQQRLKQSV